MDLGSSEGEGTAQELHAQSLLSSCSSEGQDNIQMDSDTAAATEQKRPAWKTEPDTRRPMFPRLNQSQCNTPRKSQPADLFRKSLLRSQAQSHVQPPFFNLLNTVNSRSGEACKSKQLENFSTQNVFQLRQSPVPPPSLFAHVTSAYMSPGTPKPRPDTLKHNMTDDILSKRTNELTTMLNVSDSNVEITELAAKMLKENGALKTQLAQAHCQLQSLSRQIETVQGENANISSLSAEREKQLEALKDEMSSVCNELSSVRTDLSSTEAALDSNRGELDSINRELSAYKDRNTNLITANQELQRHQGCLNSKVEVAEKSLKECANKYAALLVSFSDLKNSHDASGSVLRSLSAGIGEYRHMAGDALRKSEAFQNDIHDVSRNFRVREVLDELRETLAESQRTNDLLRDKLHLHLSQIVDLNDRIKELDAEKRELLNLLVVQKEHGAGQAIATKIEEVAERLIKREQESQDTFAETVILKEKLQVAEARIKDLQQTVANDAAKLDALAVFQKEFDKMQIESKASRSLLADRESQVTELEKMVSTVTEGFIECRKMFGTIESELSGFKSSLKENETIKVDLCARLERSQSQITEAREALTRAEANVDLTQLHAEKERQECIKQFELRLAEASCREAALAAECRNVNADLDKAKKEIAEQEVVLNQKDIQLNVLEERLEAQSVTLRLSKEQCGDVQDSTSELRMEIVVLKQQLQTYQNKIDELKGLKEVLIDKESTLAQTIEKLHAVQRNFDTQAMALQQGNDQKIVLEERLKSVELDLTAKCEAIGRNEALLSAEEEKRNALVQSVADKERAQKTEQWFVLVPNEQNANIELKQQVLQERLDAQKIAQQAMKEQIQNIQERLIASERKHAGEMEAAKEKFKGELAIIQEQRAALQASLNQAIQNTAEQRSLLDERLSKQEAATERLLGAQEKRAAAAEKEATQAKLVADSIQRELDCNIQKAKETRSQLEILQQELREAKSKVHNATIEVQSVCALREEDDRDRLALRAEISNMESHIASLRETNQSLMNKGKSLQERYENGDLSDQERSFVHFIASTAQSINEKDLLEKSNEIKLRDSTITTLQTKVKTLESTIARILRERGTEVRSEMKSLVNLSLWMSSSPQDGLNSVDVHIPTVESLHMNTLASTPISALQDIPSAGKMIADSEERKKVEHDSYPDENEYSHAVPTFSKLSGLDSDDDDMPLSELTSIFVVQGSSKRSRPPSPVTGGKGRPTRRMRGSGAAAISSKAVQSPKDLKKVGFDAIRFTRFDCCHDVRKGECECKTKEAKMKRRRQYWNILAPPGSGQSTIIRFVLSEFKA
ncbi:hypothetical protein AX17_006963 [Amanita inopinata Kibby_2008]|nr:hypothetical protein AX17_006963 [Amanita inopinata Kibby_2008]